MGNIFSKQKLVFILTIVFLAVLSTSVFKFGEKKLNMENSYASTYILMEKDFIKSHDEDYYRKILDNYNDNFIIINRDNSVKFNSSDIQISEKEDFLSLINEDDMPYLAKTIVSITNNGETVENIGPFRFSDVPEKLFLATGLPFKNKHGETQQIVFLLKDISKSVGEN